MPSFSGKLEMLLESYEQSKRSPAYKELRAKYKALKQTHQEILAALISFKDLRSPEDAVHPQFSRKSLKETHMNISQNIVVRDDEPVALTKQERRELKKARRQAESEEYNPSSTLFSHKSRDNQTCDSDETISSIISSLVKASIESDDEKLQGFTESGVQSQSAERVSEGDSYENDEICVEEEEMEELNRANEILPDEEEFEDELDCGDEEFEEELDCGDEEFEEVESDEIEIEVVEEEEFEEVEVEEETEEVAVEEETEEVEVEEEEVEEEEEEETEETEEIEIEVEEEEEEEAGVYEIERNGKRYFTTNEQDGIVYEAVGEDDVGDEIGKFVKGKLMLNKTK